LTGHVVEEDRQVVGVDQGLAAGLVGQQLQPALRVRRLEVDVPKGWGATGVVERDVRTRASEADGVQAVEGDAIGVGVSGDPVEAATFVVLRHLRHGLRRRGWTIPAEFVAQEIQNGDARPLG